MSKWQLEEQAIVAVFDVLAFKSMMSDWNAIEDVCARVSFLISIINTVAQEPSRFKIDDTPSAASIQVAQASDTFVIYCPYKSSSDIAQFLWNVQQLLFHSIRERFPLRGAITIGQVAANPAEHLFLGPAIIEAIEYEKVADWAGAIICPRLESELISRGLDSHLEALLVRHPVPYKEAYSKKCPQQLLCINWLSDSFNYINPKFIDCKFPKFNVDTNEGVSAQSKVRNTRAFMEHVVSLNAEVGPINRKVVLEPAGNGMNSIRVVLDNSDNGAA